MSIEFGAKPIQALEAVKVDIEAEAEYLTHKSQEYFRKHPDAVGNQHVEHSDGATNQRMADVYSSTSEKIGTILLQHKRDMVRAMNPYFSDLSDEELDIVVAKYDIDGIFG